MRFIDLSDFFYYTAISYPLVLGKSHIFCIIRWANLNEATGVPSLSAKMIEKVKVILPSYKEQVAIKTILSDMDNEIDELEKKLTKYRYIKQGMMSELLSGHIRLTEKEGA